MISATSVRICVRAVGVVLLVDVFDVAVALLGRHRVADVVDVEAERLGPGYLKPCSFRRGQLDHGGYLTETAGVEGRGL